MPIPDFFIVGAPKCGTTAMTEYLMAHPAIFMPDRKEIHFFGADLRAAGYQRDEGAYLDLFAQAGPDQRVGEASVWYLFSQLAAGEIKTYSPSADIIVMLRNPVDMLYSQYYQFLYNGDKLPPFAEAIETEDRRKREYEQREDERIRRGQTRRKVFHTQSAQFSEQLRRYFDVFGRDHVHVIVFDDFRRDTAAAYRATLEFLGVDPEFTLDLKVINPNKRLRSKRLRGLLHTPPPWLRSMVNCLLPAPVKRKVQRGLQRANTDYVARPPMDVGLRARLQERFRPEVAALSDLLGRDLSHWCDPEP
jgi:hypothetical protein